MSSGLFIVATRTEAFIKLSPGSCIRSYLCKTKRLNTFLAETNTMNTTEKICEILFAKDEITWQSILYELIHSGEINPWDIDIGDLARQYIEIVKKLKAFDFKVSGKAVLAAAILLRIKSTRLVGEDLEEFDRILTGQEQDDFFDEPFTVENVPSDPTQPLIPRTPQPRKRKVSIYDLMSALEKALEVKHRRVLRNVPTFDVHLPKKKLNINLSIQNVYLRIRRLALAGTENMTFDHLVPSKTKEDRVMTFVPLLHLDNRHLIELSQQEPFGTIAIMLRSEKDASKELKSEVVA